MLRRITSSIGGEPILNSLFANEVYRQSKDIPFKFGKNFRYLPKSAAHFYEEKRWESALKDVEKEDPIGILSKFKESVDQSAVGNARAVIERLDVAMRDLNYRVILVEDDQDKLEVPFNDKIRTFDNPFPSYSSALGSHSNDVGFRIEIDDYDQPTFCATYKEVSDLDEQTYGIIFVNGKAYKENPEACIITAMHECGHKAEDSYRGSFTSFEGTTYTNVVPNTERISSLYGLFAGNYLYAKGWDKERTIDKCVDQAGIYNQVIFGEQIQ